MSIVNYPLLDAIASELGDLPLALHLAGSFLAHYQRRVTPADYLAQLQAANPLNHPALQGRGAAASPTGHELHVAKTFTLSFDQLDSADPIDALARHLLARAACFAPGEPLPIVLLERTVEKSEAKAEVEKDDAGLASALAFEDAVHRLTTLGLLDPTGDETVTLHRLLVAFVPQAAPDPAAQAAVEAVALRELSTRIDQAGYIGSLLDIEVHIRTITDMAKLREDKRAANLCEWLGYWLEQIGRYEEAQPYYEQALAINKAVLGPEHSNTARSLNNLGA
ncbi:MAG: tetratricopeptide repeat protein, partial [Anaerolineae bacterium]|nr:tetratricopeptide repeat protein [Anaerolineae bacterium]